MAQFIAEIEGSRQAVHRLGGKDSGARASIKGWNRGVTVYAKHGDDGKDFFLIIMNGGSNESEPARDICRIEQDGTIYMYPDGKNRAGCKCT